MVISGCGLLQNHSRPEEPEIGGSGATADTMKTRVRKRLTKAARREQLLNVAQQIVAERGADSLTLKTLAEAAGVSKPITYDHFGTRGGLLTALFRRIDARQVAILRRALERAPATLPDVARVLSSAYMDCYLSVGTEWQAISAAVGVELRILRGDGEGVDSVARGGSRRGDRRLRTGRWIGPVGAAGRIRAATVHRNARCSRPRDAGAG